MSELSIQSEYWGRFKLVNLTPHAVRLTEPTITDPRAVCMEIAPEPVPARRTTTTEVVGWIDPQHPYVNPPLGYEKAYEGREWQIPVVRTQFGEVTGLPEPVLAVLYVVSQMVADALPGREDLVVPVDLVRDEKGVVLYARGLGLASR